MKKNILFYVLLGAMCVFALACDSNNETEPERSGGFVITAIGGSGTYLLQTDDITQGELSTSAGLENATPNIWFTYKSKVIYGLTYAQGSPGLLVSYALNANGILHKRNFEYETPRFTTYGAYGEYMVTASSLATGIKDNSTDDVVHQGVTTTLVHSETQVKLDPVIISTENMLGNGEYVTFAGFEEVNGKLYTAICPEGVSAYGASKGYNGGVTRSGTEFVDSVWVAVFNDEDFNKAPKILRDGRLSYSAGRNRSQYYSNIAADDKNNVYVFSARNARESSVKPSGVIRINTNTDEFDPNFYFNIEEASGGLRMFAVWHITGDYFFLRMMTTPTSTGDAAARFAIFNAAGSGSFSWIDGMPDAETIAVVGRIPFADGGKFYMPITTTDELPTIYVIDPVTSSAVKGVKVDAESISAVTRLNR